MKQKLKINWLEHKEVGRKENNSLPLGRDRLNSYWKGGKCAQKWTGYGGQDKLSPSKYAIAFNI